MATSVTFAKLLDEKKQLRRLELLHKAGLFAALPSGVKLKQATSTGEFRAAFKLVYRAYLEQQYILPNASELRVRIWETFPGNGTFVCKKDADVVGVTSTIMDSAELLLPSDNAFHHELNQIRDEGCRICEISNQAISPEFRQSGVVTELMRAVYGHAWQRDMTDLVCAVSPKQRKFFALMGFEQVGDTKSYSDVVYDPVVLLRMPNIQTRYSSGSPGNKTINDFWNRFYITENPYIPVFPLWQRMVNLMFSSPWETSAVFEGCAEMFESLNDKEMAIFEKNLGIPLNRLSPVTTSVSMD